MEEKLDVLNEFGEFTGKIATKEECHKYGYWHRAIYGFIIDKKGNILLQKRAKTKKLWPSKWDVPVGGHVNSNEIGREALIRECYEELGLKVKDDEIKFLIASTSMNNISGYISNHYDECYLIKKEIDLSKLKLQKEEVEEIKFFTKKEVLDMIKNDYKDLTSKIGCWNFLKKLLEMKKI